VDKEHLMKALHMELVTVVNDVGVDPNRLSDQPHTIPLLQFVCGLGPRKASALLKVYCTTLHPSIHPSTHPSHTQLEDLNSLLNTDIEHVTHWLAATKLTLNVAK